MHKTVNPNSKSKSTFWLCLCECGNHSIVSTSALRRGITQQCWNCAHAASGKAKRKSLVGQTFGELTVLEMIYDIFNEFEININEIIIPRIENK